MRASDLKRIASQQRISVGFLEKDYAISCFLKAEGDVLRAPVLFSRAMRAKSRACTASVIEI